MKQRKYSFEEVLGMDNILLRLAMYEVSGGKMRMYDEYEDLLEMQRKTSKVFNYFKSMIRCGEVELEELKDMVAKKHGPILQEKELAMDVKNMDAIIQDVDDECNERESSQKIQKSVESLLSSFVTTGLFDFSSPPKKLNAKNENNESQENKDVKKNKKSTSKKPRANRKGKKDN